MTDEMPEISEELLKSSEDSLKKIFSLAERLNEDLHSNDTGRQAAAAFMIHIIRKACSKKYTSENLEDALLDE